MTGGSITRGVPPASYLTRDPKPLFVFSLCTFNGVWEDETQKTLLELEGIGWSLSESRVADDHP